MPASTAASRAKPAKPDLTLIVSDRPATAAGVYTQNRVVRRPGGAGPRANAERSIRAVVVNSGNANACTGERGLDDAREMARLAAAACGAAPEQALVLSTGVIGEFLPMDKIAAGNCGRRARSSASDSESLTAAARGMMTTDTVHKLAGRTLKLASGEVTLVGMAKGAAMIGPNMATMLGVVLTDAALAPQDAQAALTEAVATASTASASTGT